MDWRDCTNEREKYQLYLASREWSVLKEAVHSRSGGRCERCHRNPVDAVHHLTYVRKYRERLEDLQAICDPCHEFTHAKSDVDPRMNWRVFNPPPRAEPYRLPHERDRVVVEFDGVATAFKIRERVLHPEYKAGQIVAIAGEPPKTKVQVEFQLYGLKTFTLAMSPLRPAPFLLNRTMVKWPPEWLREGHGL